MVTPEEFTRRLKAQAQQLRDVEIPKIHRRMINIANNERKKGFQGSYAPDGSKWPSLAESTIQKKKGKHSTIGVKKKKGISGLGSLKRGPSKSPEKPLIDTGSMMRPKIEADKVSGRMIMQRSRSEMISKDGSIAKIHHDGLGQKKREHWDFYKAAIPKMRRVYQNTVKKIARKLAGR